MNNEFKIGDCVKIPIADNETGVVFDLRYRTPFCDDVYPLVRFDTKMGYQGYMPKFLVKITPEERFEMILRKKNV